MQETFSGVSVVKAFNMEAYEVRKFEGINKRVAGFLKKAVKITTIQRPLVEVMAAIGVAFAIWYGIKILPLDRFAAFIAGLFLVLGLWTKIALSFCTAMYALFIFVLGQAIIRNLEILECGCFGELISIPVLYCKAGPFLNSVNEETWINRPVE